MDIDILSGSTSIQGGARLVITWFIKNTNTLTIDILRINLVIGVMAPMAIGCLVVCLSVRLVHVSQGILQTISSLTIPDWLGCDCAMIIQKINVNMT